MAAEAWSPVSNSAVVCSAQCHRQHGKTKHQFERKQPKHWVVCAAQELQPYQQLRLPLQLQPPCSQRNSRKLQTRAIMLHKLSINHSLRSCTPNCTHRPATDV